MSGHIYLSSYGNSWMVQFPNSIIYIQADRQIESFTYQLDFTRPAAKQHNYEGESDAPMHP